MVNITISNIQSLMPSSDCRGTLEINGCMEMDDIVNAVIQFRNNLTVEEWKNVIEITNR